MSDDCHHVFFFSDMLEHAVVNYQLSWADKHVWVWALPFHDEAFEIDPYSVVQSFPFIVNHIKKLLIFFFERSQLPLSASQETTTSSDVKVNNDCNDDDQAYKEGCFIYKTAVVEDWQSNQSDQHKSDRVDEWNNQKLSE